MSVEDEVCQASEQYYSQEEALQTPVTAQTESSMTISQNTEMLFKQGGSQHREMSQVPGYTTSKHEIDALTIDFFSAVSFKAGNQPAYHKLYRLFIESGQLIKTSSTVPEISTVSQFIEPRQRMVDSGALTCFKEVETAEITELFGNVAHRLSTYEKYGINQGAEFGGRGIISTQFILTDAGWKITSMAWDDERPGLTLPDRYK